MAPPPPPVFLHRPPALGPALSQHSPASHTPEARIPPPLVLAPPLSSVAPPLALQDPASALSASALSGPVLPFGPRPHVPSESRGGVGAREEAWPWCLRRRGRRGRDFGFDTDSKQEPWLWCWGLDAVLADPAFEARAGLFCLDQRNCGAGAAIGFGAAAEPNFTAAAASAKPCSSCRFWESDSESFSSRKSWDPWPEAAWERSCGPSLTCPHVGTRAENWGPALSRVGLRLRSRRWKENSPEEWL